MKLSEVLEIVCRKRKVEINDYTLKLPEAKTDLSLNLTIGQLNVTELWMQRKDRGISAGDIFLRPADEKSAEDSKEPSPAAYFNAEDSLNTFKRYVVTRKTQLFGGKQDRILTIDGEHIRISPSTDNKTFFDSVKVTSYHINSIVSCLQMSKTSPNFRLICIKDRETSKTYEFEAQSLAECSKFY